MTCMLERSAFDTALLALDLGLSPGVPMQDGSKKPDGAWKQYQTNPATKGELESWYRDGRTGVGLFTGYGDAECFEFDCRATYDDFLDAHGDAGLTELVDRIRSNYEESSPGGGIHWLYRCSERRGNTKLAERPAPTESDPHKTDALIETRGEGGFIIIAPSNGTVHPSGGAYKLLSGALGIMAVITPEERDALWNFARTFDEKPEQATAKSGPSEFVQRAWDGPARTDGKKPGEAFNEQMTWEDILEPHGWTVAFRRGDKTWWRRPGKDRDWSATTGHCKGLKVFSSSTPFSTQGTYTKFGAHAILNHGGDFKQSTKALAAAGFGEQSSQTTKSTQQSQPTAPSAPPVFDGDPRPITIALHPVPELDPRMIPPVFRAWLEDIAECACLPLAYPAAALFVALSGLIGRRVAIRPKQFDDWLVVPNLWGAIVGPPGFLKTPAVEAVMRPLKRLVADAMAEHAAKVKEHNERQLVATARRKAAQKNLDAAAKKPDATEADLQALAKIALADDTEEEPTCKRYLVNDFTIEKLGELLVENPNGLTVFRDELTGLLNTLNREGHQSDRGFLLESWNGNGSYTFDRIGRGTQHIPAACLALFGTIQPGPLARYMQGTIKGDEADGFIPRFQVLVYPDPPASYDYVDRWPDNVAKNHAYKVFKAIDELNAAEKGCKVDSDSGFPVINFTPEAQAFFNGWYTDLQRRIRSGELTDILAAHLAKYGSLMPSLALIFYLANDCQAFQLGGVPLEDAEMAAAWCEYLEQHARRVYLLCADGDVSVAGSLAERIKESLPDPFTYRQVAQKGWSGLGTVDDVERAVGILEDREWVKTVEVKSGDAAGRGRPSVKVHIHPKLRSAGEGVSS